MKTIANSFHFMWVIQSSVMDPRWWFLFVSIFVPWIFWWKLVDKKRLFEILSYGLLWAAMASWLDLVGTAFGFWTYPTKLNDNIPTLLPADVSVIPVMYMLLYQFTKRWNSFLIGSIVVAFILSFVFEPLFLTLGMLELLRWSHTKSFIAFWGLGILTKGLLACMENKQKKFFVD